MTWSFTYYDSGLCDVWNRMVDDSRNATFLFRREFMDYHADRFADGSLMAYKDGRLRALLPAAVVAESGGGRVLSSHPGLSYGGWILPRRHVNASDVMDMWESWLAFCRAEGFTGIDYKPLPSIYAAMPSAEDLYALFRTPQVSVTEVNVSTTINLRAYAGFNEMKRRQLRKALESQCTVERLTSADDYGEFHAMLTANLAERHGVRPVHTCGEMMLLAGRFPENIVMAGVRDAAGVLMAGAWLFVTPRVVHAQYIASTAAGRGHNMLTLLFHSLIESARTGAFGSDTEYFDFGISTEDHGRVLNSGLLGQKAAMGGSATVTSRFGISLQ